MKWDDLHRLLRDCKEFSLWYTIMIKKYETEHGIEKILHKKQARFQNVLKTCAF